MSITDELREFMDGADGYELWCPRHKTELLAIADRIDEKHEREMQQAHADGLNEQIDFHDNFVPSHYILLPVDADGKAIRVGDTLDGGDEFDGFSKTITVDWIIMSANCWMLKDTNGMLWYNPSAFTHHVERPAVNDVLWEFSNKVCNSGHQWGLDAADTIAEYADRIKEAVRDE